MENIKSNINKIQSELAVSGTKLLAVTKTIDTNRINFAIDCGVTLIGENKVQELLYKYDKINKENIEIHFIGKLQTNKVKYIIDKVSLIHSLDSLRLAIEINKCAAKIGKVQELLIQVNIANELSKGGIAVDDLTEFVYQIKDLLNLKVRGLMCIPPIAEFQGQNDKYFAKLQKMQVDINDKKIDNIHMNILSMGMSEDYISAVKHGATIVRIGSKIFGNRIYNKMEE